MSTPMKDIRITESFGFQKNPAYDLDTAYRVITEKEYDDMLVKMEQQRQQIVQDQNLINVYRQQNEQYIKDSQYKTKRINEYQERLDNQAKTIAHMQETHKNLIKKLDMAEVMVDTFSEEIENLNKEVAEWEHDYEELGSDYDELEFGYDELYKNYEARITTPVCSTNPDIHLVITITG